MGRCPDDRFIRGSKVNQNNDIFLNNFKKRLKEIIIKMMSIIIKMIDIIILYDIITINISIRSN